MDFKRKEEKNDRLWLEEEIKDRGSNDNTYRHRYRSFNNAIRSGLNIYLLLRKTVVNPEACMLPAPRNMDVKLLP